MDTLNSIKTRRSIRRFRPAPLPRNVINTLQEAIMWAPSAGNLQSRKFYFITNKKLQTDLADAAHEQQFVSEAPLTVVACSIPERSAQLYGSRGRDLYAINDTSASIQNLLLTATSLRLGSCWVGSLDEEKVKKILHLEKEVRPIAVIPIGYPDEDPTPPEQVNREQIIKEIS